MKDRKLRILVVDDHDVVHWGFRLMLGEQPWVERFLSARTGDEAIELARRYTPHVALVDLFLGAESGAEVCTRIREASPRTNVLLISGAGRISATAARAAGASGFVSKDWDAGRRRPRGADGRPRDDRVRAPGRGRRRACCPSASARCST